MSGAWRVMLRTLNLSTEANRLLNSSLAVVRCLALNQSTDRVSQIPVLITSLRWVGGDAAVTLRDPTATLCATVHAAVFSEYTDTPIRIGTVLLLKGVCACAYAVFPRGFRVDVAQSIHLNVRLANVIRIFNPPQYEAQSSSPVLCNPVDVYSKTARNPPLPVHRNPVQFIPTPRQNPLPPPSSRVLHQLNRSPTAPAAPMAPGLRKRPYSHPSSNAPPKRPAFPPRRAPSVITHSTPRIGLTRPGSAISRPSPGPPSASGRGATSAVPVAALTDDHLDSLLSGFDLDGVVAAYGRSQTLSQSNNLSQTAPLRTTAPSRPAAALNSNATSLSTFTPSQAASAPNSNASLSAPLDSATTQAQTVPTPLQPKAALKTTSNLPQTLNPPTSPLLPTSHTESSVAAAQVPLANQAPISVKANQSQVIRSNPKAPPEVSSTQSEPVSSSPLNPQSAASRVASDSGFGVLNGSDELINNLLEGLGDEFDNDIG